MILVNTRNLEAEMARNGIIKKDIVNLIGKTYKTVQSRFNGKSEWTYEECIMIRDRLFPTLTLDYLFPYDNREKADNMSEKR